jgi:hypothetical protein
MFLHVERVRIEIFSDYALAWEDFRHGLTKHVSNNAQEHAGDIDGLWLEVEYFLEHGCKDRQSKPSVHCQQHSSKYEYKDSQEEHAERPRVKRGVILNTKHLIDDVLCRFDDLVLSGDIAAGDAFMKTIVITVVIYRYLFDAPASGASLRF